MWYRKEAVLSRIIVRQSIFINLQGQVDQN